MEGSTSNIELVSNSGSSIQNIIQSNKAIIFITGPSSGLTTAFRMGEKEGSTFYQPLEFRHPYATYPGGTRTISMDPISGIITASNFAGPITGGHNIVAGIITATQIDLNGDIDVDGHTNLDTVSIAGVSTFTGAIDANGALDVAGVINSSTDVRINGSSVIDEAVAMAIALG